eukprot:1439441-Pyramimonas_sp.AAC.1
MSWALFLCPGRAPRALDGRPVGAPDPSRGRGPRGLSGPANPRPGESQQLCRKAAAGLPSRERRRRTRQTTWGISLAEDHLHVGSGA